MKIIMKNGVGIGNNEDCSELIMTSFKWNVHNHGRTMNLKWLAEIVHTNPAWLNPKTAEKFGLADGDWIELTSYYSQELEARSPHLGRDDLESVGDRRVVGTMRVPIVTMQGIHPQAIAMPIAPDPVSGQQSFHDTVVKITKVG